MKNKKNIFALDIYTFISYVLKNTFALKKFNASSIISISLLFKGGAGPLNSVLIGKRAILPMVALLSVKLE